MPPKSKPAPKKGNRPVRGRNVNKNNYGYVSRMSDYYYGASNGDFRGPDSVWNFHDGEEWSCGGGGINLALLAIWAGELEFCLHRPDF